MRAIKQFCILLAAAFAGEVLHWLLPLPVPAALYGILLLFAALQTGLVPLGQVREAGEWLTSIMPVLFVPPAVGLMQNWALVAPRLGGLLALVLASTAVTFGAAGLVTQRMLGRKERKERQTDDRMAD